MPLWFKRLRPPSAGDDELIRCQHCASDFVSPVEWAERGETDWWMRLRCGQCGETREVVVSQATADRYDRALDRSSDVIASTLMRLDRERMAAEADAFATALRLDLLDAVDFGAAP
jgi:hypothetical protein